MTSGKENLESRVAGSQKDSAIGLDVLGGSAVPDLNSILAFKVLSEGTEDPQKKLYARLLKEEKKYIEHSLELLSNDGLLRLKLGGFNMKTAMALAQILRKKAEEINFESHIDKTVQTIIQDEYKKDGGNLSAGIGFTGANMQYGITLT